MCVCITLVHSDPRFHSPIIPPKYLINITKQRKEISVAVAKSAINTGHVSGRLYLHALLRTLQLFANFLSIFTNTTNIA